MFCTNCGCKNSDDAKFCKQCGTRLETLVAEETVEVKEPEVTAPETTETEAPAETTATEESTSDTEDTAAAAAATATATATTTAESTATQAETPQPEAAAETAGATAGTAGTAAAPVQETSLSGLREMIRLGIASPFKGINFANNPVNWLSGLLIFIVSDVIIALLITLAANSFVSYMGGSFNIAGLGLTVGYSSGTIFLTALILMLISDVLEIFIILGIGKAFGGKFTLKQWIAVCATSQILFRMLAMVALLLMLAGAGGIIVAMILLSIGALSYLILMFKAFEVSTGLENNKLFYGFICAYLVYIIVFSIATGIVSAINTANMYNNTYNTYNDFFNNNSF
ncbi:MAG: zinc ribbon domain-containing protein [Firmicutes bacterium]|nr:zinc ribbon domain-containing protein [Bacillota bacterium]